MRLGKLYSDFSKFFKNQSEVVQMGPLFADGKACKEYIPFGFYALGADNSIAILENTSDGETEDKLICTIFPPPKANEVCSLHFSIATQKVFLLNCEGVIQVYRFKTETKRFDEDVMDQKIAILEAAITGHEIFDEDRKPVKTKIACIEVLRTRPPRFDKFRYKQHLDYAKREDCALVSQHEDYLAIGMQTGTLVIVSTSDPFRVLYRNQIVQTTRIMLMKDFPHLGCLLCVSADHALVLVKPQGEGKRTN